MKLLTGTTFDVFIDSAAFYPSAPKSTAVVEAFWRRREHISGAGRPRSRLGGHHFTFSIRGNAIPQRHRLRSDPVQQIWQTEMNQRRWVRRRSHKRWCTTTAIALVEVTRCTL